MAEEEEEEEEEEEAVVGPRLAAGHPLWRSAAAVRPNLFPALSPCPRDIPFSYLNKNAC